MGIKFNTQEIIQQTLLLLNLHQLEEVEVLLPNTGILKYRVRQLSLPILEVAISC
jgi:hypothetical protein